MLVFILKIKILSFDSGKIFKVKSNAEYSVYVPTEGDVPIRFPNC